MDKTVDVIVGVVIVSICIGLSAYCYHRGLVRGRNEVIENIVKPDTNYNKVTLDSIELRIIKKDSIIYNIKNKMKDEITESFNLDVSASVELFKSLAGAD